MPPRIVAVHQPNFFPWLGFFDKIIRADVFVLLDHVQFPKSEGNWSNRVRLDVNGDAAWVTMPVDRGYSGFRRIDEMRIDNLLPWRRKLLQLLRANYGRAPFFRETFPEVEAWVEAPAVLVAEYNSNAITAVCGRLGVRSDHIVRSSSLAVTGAKSEMVANVVKEAGGSVYLSGDGSAGYLDESTLLAAGVEVEYQRFVHPVYRQHGRTDFLAGLSVLDLIFNCGFDGASQVLGASVGPNRGASA